MRSITESMPRKLPDVYNDKSFIHLVESMVNEVLVEYKQIEAIDTHKFEFDFYGLLKRYNVPRELHYITLRLNNLKNPTDYQSEDLFIVVPENGQVPRLRKLFKSTYSKK